MFLQETHLTQEEHKKLTKITKARVFSSSFSLARRGVASIIKDHIPFEKINCIQDKEGRFVSVVGKIEIETISLMNVYYPPDTRLEFMIQIIEVILTQGKGIISIGGDFNLVFNPNMDSTSGTHKAEKTATILRRTCTELGLIDVWRALHPTTKDYTYYSGRHSTYSRLDYFFMDQKDISFINQCTIGTITDHAAITLKVKLNSNKGKSM